MTKRRRAGQVAQHKREIQDSATNGKEELLEAMVAAGAAIAFADGSLDIRERRRLFNSDLNASVVCGIFSRRRRR